MKIKKTILVVLIIILNSVIFGFSSQDGEKSKSLSDAVAIKVIDTYAEIKNKEITSTRKKEIVKNTRFLVRKLAHFSVYFLMGILVYMLICCYDVKHPIIAIIFCILFATCDEMHQLFSDGRSGRLLDVLIDTYGSLAGILLVRVIYKIRFKVKERMV